jgi:hypothetical protein
VAAADPCPCPASCRSCSFLLPPVVILRTRSALSSPLAPLTLLTPPPAPPHQSPATYPPPSVLHQLSSSISPHVPWVPIVCSSSPTLHSHNGRFTLAWGLCTASPLRRPPDPSCSLLPFSLPILWAASPVIGHLRVPIRITLTPTRTLPRFSVTATFSPKTLSPVS